MTGTPEIQRVARMVDEFARAFGVPDPDVVRLVGRVRDSAGSMVDTVAIHRSAGGIEVRLSGSLGADQTFVILR